MNETSDPYGYVDCMGAVDPGRGCVNQMVFVGAVWAVVIAIAVGVWAVTR